LPALEKFAVTDGDHFSLLRLLFGGIGNDDASITLFRLDDAFDDDTVMQWTERHIVLLMLQAALKVNPRRIRS
jgi:hypothetical protein